MATKTLPDQVPQKLEVPPGHPNVPYVLQYLCGEIIYIPCSRSATRLLVTGKESDNAFAVVGSGGAQSDPIGFHYHNQAHDVFLCIKGQVNVWAGDQARTMNPGDFASAPPVGQVKPFDFPSPFYSQDKHLIDKRPCRKSYTNTRFWEIIPSFWV